MNMFQIKVFIYIEEKLTVNSVYNIYYVIYFYIFITEIIFIAFFNNKKVNSSGAHCPPIYGLRLMQLRNEHRASCIQLQSSYNDRSGIKFYDVVMRFLTDITGIFCFTPSNLL
jgi:hypothetical protein